MSFPDTVQSRATNTQHLSLSLLALYSLPASLTWGMQTHWHATLSISCQNLTIILIILLGYESQSIVTITRLYRGGVWRLLRCKSGQNNEGANLQVTVGLPVCSSNVYPSLGIHLLPLFFQALLQHTLPFFPSPCNLSSYSISSTSPGSVLLGAPLWGLTGGLHLCFWSLSVASDVAPWGLWAVLTFLKGTPMSRSSEDPWREAEGNTDISYLQ